MVFGRLTDVGVRWTSSESIACAMDGSLVEDES